VRLLVLVTFGDRVRLAVQYNVHPTIPIESEGTIRLRACQFNTSARGRLLFCTLFAVSVTAGCRSSRPALENGPKPDIVLITIDALRADHLGLYGYDRPTSPNLDALARESVVVRNHIAQAPYTKASIASLFTGLFPTAHKAFTTSRDFNSVMAGHLQGSLPVTDVLAEELTTIAESLAAAGYQTIGLTTNPFLQAEFGFAQGFQRYEFLSEEHSTFTPAPAVVARALSLLAARDRNRPVFLWFHLMEPHSPYAPGPTTRAFFSPRQPPLFAPPDVIPSWLAAESTTDAHVYEALYDAEVHEADEALGAFFSALRDRGLWTDLLLVVTADHGEEFYDHGGFEHNRTLYDEMLRVPLIVKARGLSPGVVDAQTEAVDLMPTLAARGRGRVPAGLHGQNVWPVLSMRSRGERFAYAERVGDRYTLRTREWKLISNLQGAHELYRLTDDPREQHNLASEDVSRAIVMRDRLTRILASAMKTGEAIQGRYAPIPPRVLNRLKALGYVQ
jgi:arylsulfatase A-like enzyme